MVSNIVFHTDIDGIMSAAFVLRYATKGSYRLFPVISTARGERFDKLVRSMNLGPDDKLTIVDFESHPRADVWVDHHQSTIMGSQPVFNNKITYDPSAKSAAELVFKRMPGMPHEINKDDLFNINNIIHATNMIDSAGYPDVNYVFNNDSPLMILRAHIQIVFPSEMMFCRVVETLANTNFNLKETMFRLNITGREVDKLRKRAIEAGRHVVYNEPISIVEQRRPYQFPRYFESYLNTKIKYNIRFSIIAQNKWKLQLAHNQWHKTPNEHNIGQYLSSLEYIERGGGHYNVGGGKILEEDKQKFIDDFLILINKDEVEMTQEEGIEKYGVDAENDKVEKKAQEMVKTGEANSVDEAREKAITQEEKKEEVDARNKDG